ncbi:MAG: phosphatidylinositol-specific phospholipase C/glycerophosphodiester phosphodiesterase family protein [Fidelibacterota bacterium]|nr:MAG: phosphatidylinositol-specific phospholipase C/glycerophosphodiester phosphodiesterase family protein [Candidatus Neomarinimicrobiota bacterium]
MNFTTYKKHFHLWIPLLILTGCRSPQPAPLAEPGGSPVPLSRAHAHNDYLHSRPLYDALDHGFTSVEADIFLEGSELLVAHYSVDLQPSHTLQSLYLDPLRQRIKHNGGGVYRDSPQFTLLIDIKSEAEATYKALRKVLQTYADILVTYDTGGDRTGPIAVIISGNRPRKTMESETIHYATYDGRLEDLGTGAPADFIPLISDRWGAFFSWDGEGAMPEDEREQLRSIVAAAHAEGRRVRFWATPDEPGEAREAVWRELVAAGVDLINTDDLAGLQRFLLDQ